MKPSSAHMNELKSILDNIRVPERLNEHPWTKSLVVLEQAGSGNDPSSQKTAGYQLITALGVLFRKMMPSTPPRRGKRLDTRWCEFGLLAAEYFAPFLYGSIYPTSLRDAGGRIDQAIPLFVFGKPGYDLPEGEVSRYRLFDDHTPSAPISTLSDWHAKGLQRLADLLVTREEYLSQKLHQSSPILEVPSVEFSRNEAKKNDAASASPTARRPQSKLSKLFTGLALAILLAAILLAGLKAFQIYREAKIVRNDLGQIQSLLSGSPKISSIEQAGPLLSTSGRDWTRLKSDVQPVLWMGKWLAWVPLYGGDLAQAEPLMDMATSLIGCADETSLGISPLVQEVQAQGQTPKMPEIVKLLVAAQPHFSNANATLNEAIRARNQLDVGRLSPGIRSLLIDKIDPNLPFLKDGLVFALTLPKLMGASASGPQTYLILFQNEDELRATGGFITAVGTVVVNDGDVLSYLVEDSTALDDLTKPYPPAPWQLDSYMAAQILLLRDSNWSPDFPTSAAMAEYLYAYTRYHSVDGIIAIDQHAVQMLLSILGPINLPGVSYPITSANVIEYMREAKYGFGNILFDPNQRKDFISQLGEAILMRLGSGPNLSLETASKVLVEALDERHILVESYDPGMASVLADRGWDGAVRPGAGDFLMVVDSNVGFTKGNAVVKSEFSYNVDLSNPAAPTASLSIVQTNNVPENNPCEPLAAGPMTNTYEEFVNRCYWDYLRVYKPAGTQLLNATPHAVPAESMIRGESVPAQVDTLDEAITGVQGYGTLLLIPTNDSLETDFRFLLPSAVVSTGSDPNTRTYALRVQKQPGTQAIPIHICVRLPVGSGLIYAPAGGNITAGLWCLASNLLTDVNIQLKFSSPEPDTQK